MKWNELRRIAENHGWYRWRSGANHDIYRHEGRNDLVTMPRHGAKEVTTGIYNKLKKQIGF